MSSSRLKAALRYSKRVAVRIATRKSKAADARPKRAGETDKDGPGD